MSEKNLLRVISKISKNEYLIEVTLTDVIVRFDIYNKFYNTENSGYMDNIEQALGYGFTTRNDSDYDIYLNLLDQEFED